MKKFTDKLLKFIEDNFVVIFVVIALVSTSNTYYITTNDTSNVKITNHSTFNLHP